MWDFENDFSAKDINSRWASKQEEVNLFYNPPINSRTVL